MDAVCHSGQGVLDGLLTTRPRLVLVLVLVLGPDLPCLCLDLLFRVALTRESEAVG